MTDHTPEHKPWEEMSDQRRAFLEYKRRVGESGKPFFPHGVWHDVVAAVVMMAIVIGLSVVWFSTANCDSWWNPSCDRVSTPAEQEQFTPDHPGKAQLTDKGELDESADQPVLGLLYEEKADPATTSYHPRPEWYFYFLFYLLIVFSNPQLVVLGTIIVPTIWLVMLLVWPFVDRRKERRPSRRPVAMAAMVLTAITLLSFTYLGSQSGKEKSGGPEGLTDEQMAMPGYAVLFEDGIYDTCGSCHQLGGIGNGGPGPNLDAVGTRYKSADDITEVLANGLPGGMPIKGGSSMTDEQAAQVAAFLKTLGAAGDAASLAGYGQSDWDRVTGAADEGDATSNTAPQDGKDAADSSPASPATDGDAMDSTTGAADAA